MASQTKMPGVVPTPPQARARLRGCRAEVDVRRRTVEGLKLQLKAAKEDESAAMAELDEAEADSLASDDASDEAGAAQAKQTKQWKRAKGARDARAKTAKAHALAKADMRVAEAALASARDDIEALQDGRRSPR